MLADTYMCKFMCFGQAIECEQKSIHDENKPAHTSNEEWTRCKSAAYERIARKYNEHFDYVNAEKFWVLALEIDKANILALDSYRNFEMMKGNVLKSITLIEHQPENFSRAMITQCSILFGLNYICEDREAVDNLYSRHVQFGNWMQKALSEYRVLQHANTKNPNRRIKIGYVAADFNGRHPVSHFGAALLGLDREKFHVTVYSCKPQKDNKVEVLNKPLRY